MEEGARLLAVPPLRRSETATRAAEDKKFLLGDFLLQVPVRYVDALAEALGQEASAFRSYRDVAEKIPPGSRVAASWAVHRQLKDSPELLRDGLTVREAAIASGKNPIDSKAAHRRSVGEKADEVRMLLSDPAVAAVIEAEATMSKEERKARQAARNMASEMAAREKQLEAELKAAKSAKSSFEATVHSELELFRAAQLAEAVGSSITDLEQPERLAEALKTLISSATEALEKFVPVDDPRVIDGEVWRDRSEAYGLPDSAQRITSLAGRTVIDQVD